MEFEGRKKISTELNIAPLIDVVFLLLVFFMLTSTLITQEGMEVALPTSSESQRVEPSPPIEVALMADGQLYLNGAPVIEALVVPKLSSLLSDSPEEPIVLKSDAHIPVQRLIDAMGLIRKAGGTNISIATQRQ